VPLGVAEELLARRFVGREADLRWLHDRRAAAAGRGGAVLLLGEAGMGKSRLAAQFAAEVRASGGVVLTGRAVQSGTAQPYRPLAEAFASAARDLSAGGGPAAAVGAAVQRLAPSTPVPVGYDVVAAAETVIAGLRAVTSTVAPAVLSVDDAHWADADTGDVLGYLCDNSAAHGALLVITARPDVTVSSPTAHRLVERRVVGVHELGPLSVSAVDDLVRSCLDHDVPDDVLRFVRRRAGGSPYAAEELVAGLVRSGALVREGTEWLLVAHRLTTVAPTTVAASIRRRVEALAPQTRRILEVAALLGHTFDWRPVGAIVQLDVEAVLASLREAAYSGLVSSDEGDVLSFRHALTRDEVLAGMLAPDRRALAGAALDVLGGAAEGSTAGDPETVLALAELAGRRTVWRTLLVDTGRRAAAQGGVATAVARLQTAIDTAPADDAADELRLAAMEELATVLAVTGDAGRASSVAEQALRAMAGDRGGSGRGTRLRLTLARAALATGRLEEAARHLTIAGAQASGDESPQVTAPDLQVVAAHLALERGDLEAARAGAAEVLAAREGGAEVAADLVCEAMELLGRAERVRDVAAAERWFAAALDTAQLEGRSVWVARALHELGTIDLLETMRLDRLEEARNAAVATGVPATVVGADFHLAEALVARGDSFGGRAVAERAVALAARIRSPMLPWAWLTIARSFAHERDDVMMETALAEAARAAPDDPAVEAGALGRVRVMRALHGADADGARSFLDAAVDLLTQVPGHHFPHWGLWAVLRTMADPGQAAGVRSVAEAGAGAGTRVNRAYVRLAEAVAAGAGGEPVRATAAWDDGIALLRGYESIDWMVHLTGWLVADRALADGWGQPSRWLQDGVRWFSSHDQPVLASACRRVLTGSGLPAPRSGRGESDVPHDLQVRGVTSREVDVLRLLAARLTNAEIAEQLYLSPRTVEKHVASLLRKTGNASRADLAALVSRPERPA